MEPQPCCRCSVCIKFPPPVLLPSSPPRASQEAGRCRCSTFTRHWNHLGGFYPLLPPHCPDPTLEELNQHLWVGPRPQYFLKSPGGYSVQSRQRTTSLERPQTYRPWSLCNLSASGRVNAQRDLQRQSKSAGRRGKEPGSSPPTVHLCSLHQNHQGTFLFPST